MFTAGFPSIPYSDPWILPLCDRIKKLRSGKYRVAYFYEEPNNSTFRYRVYNMAQVLNSEKDSTISASYFFLQDLNLFDEIADLADILIICRSRYCNRINYLITKFRARGKRVLFDIDDLVFNPSYVHQICDTLAFDNTNSALWDTWFAYTSRMAETLRLCNGAIATNHFLATRISEFVEIPVSVVPNFINKEQLELSERIFQKKQELRFEKDEKISIGYFSGSPSHKLDYEIVTSALASLLEDNPKVEIIVAGYIEIGATLSRFKGRIKYHHFRDYVNLQSLIGSVEFNLIPLQSNVFTDCKSELKYFEAAIVGTVSIASPSFTYASAIRDGENGYLAQAHQWLSVIQNAISNFENYSNIAMTAYADARKHYAWFNQREKILKSLGI